MDESLLSKKHINGVYIPAGLLVLGTFIVKREWVPYAIVLAVALGGFKLYNSRESGLFMLGMLITLALRN
jgi:cytochrome-b5 reductase